MSHGRLILVALVAVITMSAVPVMVKSTSANETTIAVARLAIAVLAFGPIALWQRRIFTLDRSQWQQLATIGAVFALHWYTYFLSIKLATAAIAALVITTYGVQYLLLAWRFNGERIAPAEWLGIAACFAGCIIVSPDLSFTDSTTTGIAIGLFSAFLYAALPLLHQRAGSMGTLERTWGQFFFALLCFLPFWSTTDWAITQTDYALLLALGLVSTVVAHGLWVKASTELPAIFTSMIYYLYLPLAMIGSAVFIGEEMTTQKIFGASLVICASASLSWYRFKRTAG